MIFYCSAYVFNTQTRLTTLKVSLHRVDTGRRIWKVSPPIQTLGGIFFHPVYFAKPWGEISHFSWM
jgi:hypothetical protein